MTRPAAVAALAAAVLLAAGARAGEAGSPASFDYLYIRAHEGNASGGHAALRFEDVVFDFQHEGGWIVPRREPWPRFEHRYRTLQNRSIEVSRIAVEPGTASLLRDAFERRLLAQSQQLALRDELRGDAALLEGLATGASPRVEVRGPGFFAPAAEPAGGAPPVLGELRARIAERFGPSRLAQRRDEAESALRRTPLAPLAPDPRRIDPLAYPVAPRSLSRRVGDALAARAAVELLDSPRPLAAGTRAGESLPPDASLALDPALRDRLLAARAALAESAVGLAASRRSDWGEALLLAAARLAVIDESLAADRLVVLDALPRDAVALRVTARRRALLPALEAEARRDLDGARVRLASAGAFSELDWLALEQAASRVEELRAARLGAPSFRIATDPPPPEGRASIAFAPQLAGTSEDAARALAAARAAERDWDAALGARYRYDLVARNCVSELFRTIEAALADGAAAPPAADREALRAFVAHESERRLGGYVHPIARANFIPFVSSRHVRARWSVAERIHLPSARESAVEREGTLTAALRESNVWTSSVFTPADGSDFFVFFTDGDWPLRPLLGAVNLGAGLARAGVGVIELPFDRGRGLRAGLEGAVFSVPELFFANIRKGTSEYVPPELRPPPG